MLATFRHSTSLYSCIILDKQPSRVCKLPHRWIESLQISFCVHQVAPASGVSSIRADSCPHARPECVAHHFSWRQDDSFACPCRATGARFDKPARKVDVRLPGKGNSNSPGARLVHLTITMIKWLRTRRFSRKNSLYYKPLGPLGSSSSQHRRTLELVL